MAAEVALSGATLTPNMADLYDLGDPQQLMQGMREARAAIARDDVIVIPTDTVYGIAANAFSAAGVTRLLEAKGRTRQSPPPVLVADVATFDALASEIPEAIRELLAAHAPGPLTVILPAQPSLHWDLGETQGTVALRVPDHAVARELLRETGPLAVSSANLHGKTAPDTAAGAMAQLGERVALILDAGRVGGEASTILDATGLTSGHTAPARIVRQGALPRQAIAEFLGDLLEPATDTQDASAVLAPGQAADQADPNGSSDAATTDTVTKAGE